MKAKAREGAAGLGGIADQIDALGIAFDAGLIAPPHPVAQGCASCALNSVGGAPADRSFRLRPPSRRKQREGLKATTTTTTTTTIMTAAKGKEQREKAKRMRDSSFYCAGSK
jgi:hypothetical protein